MLIHNPPPLTPPLIGQARGAGLSQPVPLPPGWIGGSVYDVIVVGAGPAGLQAAVSAASDGKSVVVLAAGVGGQIGETPRFENSILAEGQSGPELVKTFVEACNRFNVDWAKGNAYSLSGWRGDFSVRWEWPRMSGKMLPDDEIGRLRGKAVILAVGKAWKVLPIPGLRQLVASGGASYGPKLALHPAWDAHTDRVILYGGGPASGQAAVVLAERGVPVTLLCRSELSMPQYLIDRIDSLAEHVTVRIGAAILAVAETDTRRIVVYTDEEMHEGTHLMVCAGQEPATGWLKGSNVTLASDGRIAIHKGQTGTTLDGVYAVGDCRAGSAHRVPSAMGDGAMAVHELWRAGKVEDRPACHPIPPQPEDAACPV